MVELPIVNRPVQDHSWRLQAFRKHFEEHITWKWMVWSLGNDITPETAGTGANESVTTLNMVLSPSPVLVWLRAYWSGRYQYMDE